MDASNPLADLKEIHLPKDVSAFPLAPIWNILIAIIIIAIIFFTIRHFIKQAKLRRFNIVNEQIIAIENNSILTDAEVIIEISNLLKRVALLKFSDKKPEFIYGADWLAFLNMTGKTTNFSHDKMQSLGNIYKNNSLKDKEYFFLVIRNWVRKVI